MPYIEPHAREQLDLLMRHPTTAGELNYLLTRLCHNYRITKGLSYQTCNDILGALEGAKQEFYRRVVAPYENTKIGENGDVY